MLPRKRALTLVFFTASLFCHTAVGQQAGSAPEPQFNGIFFYIDGQTGELKQLEQQTPRASAKMKAFGVGGMKVTLEMDGEKSPVRFQAGQPIILIVRVSNPREDPGGTIGMTLYQPKNGKRLSVPINTHAFGMGASKNTDPSVRYNYERYGESSLKLTFPNIPQGEWCIGNNDSKFNNCFGVESGSIVQTTDGTYAGRYVNEKNGSNYIELNPDGTFHLRQSKKDYNGQYRVDGGKLVMVINNKELPGSEISEGVIIDNGDGSKWVRQSKPPQPPGPSDSSSEVLTDTEILHMVEAKLPDSLIITKIKSSVCNFDVSTNSLIQLKKAGVSDAVLQAMTQAAAAK
jgi:hypothetical protein